MKFQHFLLKVKIDNELNNTNESFILNDYQKELFKVSINEKGPISLDKKIMTAAYNELSKRFGIKKEDLDYIGYTDLSFIKDGAKLLQFNIINKNHKSYKSTVAFKYMG